MNDRRDTGLGIALMILTSAVFSFQDGISRHLGGGYGVMMIVMIRFWFMALFVTLMAARHAGGIRAVAATRNMPIHLLRGFLLVAEISAMFVSFVRLGLVETHAVFACYPLIVAALSGPVLGERVGWRRWTAIGIGFVGILIILQPGFGVFSPWAILPLASATMFGLYGLMTRYAARSDTAQTSFFWTCIAGMVFITPLGLWSWQPMAPADWGWMAGLCLTSLAGHFLMIKAYEVAEASAIQPFAYLQLVFIAIIGVTLFNEVLRPNVVAGAVVVVCAGIFTLWRARIRAQGS